MGLSAGLVFHGFDWVGDFLTEFESGSGERCQDTKVEFDI